MKVKIQFSYNFKHLPDGQWFDWDNQGVFESSEHALNHVSRYLKLCDGIVTINCENPGIYFVKRLISGSQSTYKCYCLRFCEVETNKVIVLENPWKVGLNES